MHLMITVQKHANSLNHFPFTYIRNVDRAILNTVFENAVQLVWRLSRDTLNITCNFLYCNHQMHRAFLINLYNKLKLTNIFYCSVCMHTLLSYVQPSNAAMAALFNISITGNI
jgi:hypothetical protein